MRTSKFSEAQIFSILKEAESGLSVGELCRKHGMSDATFYKWRAKYGGMDVSMLKEYRTLEEENRRLKKMYADACMDREVLKELIEKKL